VPLIPEKVWDGKVQDKNLTYQMTEMEMQDQKNGKCMTEKEGPNSRIRKYRTMGDVLFTVGPRF